MGGATTGGAQGDDHEVARGAYERLGANAAANWAVKVKSAIVAAFPSSLFDSPNRSRAIKSAIPPRVFVVLTSIG